jgi:transcriptional regulator of acetoin/glycerol metabolism
MAQRQLAHHAARIEAAIASGQAARSALVASWRRSARLHRLDPVGARAPERLSDGELCQVREKVGPLLAAAKNVMDRLHQAVGVNGCCVLLADRQGVPVDRRGG